MYRLEENVPEMIISWPTHRTVQSVLDSILDATAISPEAEVRDGRVVLTLPAEGARGRVLAPGTAWAVYADGSMSQSDAYMVVVSRPRAQDFGRVVPISRTSDLHDLAAAGHSVVVEDYGLVIDDEWMGGAAWVHVRPVGAPVPVMSSPEEYAEEHGWTAVPCA